MLRTASVEDWGRDSLPCRTAEALLMHWWLHCGSPPCRGAWPVTRLPWGLWGRQLHALGSDPWLRVILLPLRACNSLSVRLAPQALFGGADVCPTGLANHRGRGGPLRGGSLGVRKPPPQTPWTPKLSSLTLSTCCDNPILITYELNTALRSTATPTSQRPSLQDHSQEPYQCYQVMLNVVLILSLYVLI